MRTPSVPTALSPYLVLASLAARAAGKPRLAGFLVLTSGLGYFGIVWERAAGASLTGIPNLDRDHLAWSQLIGHGALAALGLRWLREPMRGA